MPRWASVLDVGVVSCLGDRFTFMGINSHFTERYAYASHSANGTTADVPKIGETANGTRWL